MEGDGGDTGLRCGGAYSTWMKNGNNVGRDLRKVHDEATCREKSQGRTRSTAVRRSTRKCHVTKL